MWNNTISSYCHDETDASCVYFALFVCFYSHICMAICDVCSVSFLHVYILQENPSEEDAAIVDKILSLRLTKKEVCSLN